MTKSPKQTDNPFDRMFPITDHILHITGLHEDQCELLEDVKEQLIKMNKNLAVIAQVMIKQIESNKQVETKQEGKPVSLKGKKNVK